MSRPIPPAWQKIMDEKTLGSGRRLAEAMGVSQETVQRLIHGEQSSRATVRRAAEVLGVGVDKVDRLRGEAPRQPFRLPDDADRLNAQQRSAVLSVVRAMLDNSAGERSEQAPGLRAVARKRGGRGGAAS